jgi:hypothetical protein
VEADHVEATTTSTTTRVINNLHSGRAGKDYRDFREAVTMSSRWKDIAVAEEIGAAVERERKPAVERTQIINPESSVAIDGVHEVCNILGSGTMHEFLVISPATQFTLYIKVDDKPPVYDDTYARLAQISDDTAEVTAYQDDITNEYIIHIGELKFSKSLIVRLFGIGIATRIFLKYTLSPPLERVVGSTEIRKP